MFVSLFLLFLRMEIDIFRNPQLYGSLSLSKVLINMLTFSEYSLKKVILISKLRHPIYSGHGAENFFSLMTWAPGLQSAAVVQHLR